MKKRKKSSTFSAGTPVANVVWHVLKWLFYIIMVIFSITFVYTFVWTLVNSLKTSMNYTEDMFGLPKLMDFENYKTVLTEMTYKGYSLWGMLGNSLKLILIHVICTMTFPQMAAYTLARFDFRGKNVIMTAVYLSMMIPVVGTTASILNFLISTKLYNSFWGVFVLGMGGLGFGQMVLTTFYRGIDPAYAEAAYMDGASELQVFLRIYYPQSWPLMSINLLNVIIHNWNDYMTGYLYLPEHPTIALGLQQMQTTYVSFKNDTPIMFAGIVLAMIPILIIFAFLGPKMMNSKDMGALK